MDLKIIDNCCSSYLLDCVKHIAIQSENWNLLWPQTAKVEDRFLKLDIVGEKGVVKNPFLAGLVQGLLIQIYEASGQEFFIPDIYFCGISMKDKHRTDNIHTDQPKKDEFVKIVGIINSDWKEEWGGGFFHNGTHNYIKPTSFCIFEPSENHSAEEIFTDKKRFAIDFTVQRK